jgi:predicted DNA-binding transcriptional regulator AlpA
VRRERPRSNDNVAQARTVRLVEIAELLGVNKQRAHQIAEEKGFPAPLAEDVRGRVWSRYEVQGWAKRWRREKPWR